NVLFKNGRIEESLAFYKKALELNPRDFDAKYNYELARKIMQNQQNQDKSQQNQDQQDKQDQSDQSKEQTQPDKSQDQQQHEQQSQAQEQQSQQSRREKEKSQEEAAQVLDALKNDEKKLMQERMRVKASGLTKEKDW
ncbi:MAG: tetratricopeptide repeat protein, partial [Candidatus Marinimicrobia bacterium]|nr:tetratricopeptide repeat protein [Candidatus Neomarinimicrobiota bacterium]